MAAVTFDPVAFRAQIPAYADPTKYPDAMLNLYWDFATVYVSKQNTGVLGVLTGDQLLFAINLMAAHLIYLAALIQAGNTPGLVLSSTVDKVSVTLAEPPKSNQWQWWLNLSPYGAQLLALLTVRSAGGFYIGGLPELSAFRKVGGIF